MTTAEIAPVEDLDQVYEVRAHRAPEFRAKVAKANKRLTRAGASAQFVFDEEKFERTERRGGIQLEDGTSFGGSDVLEPYVRFTLASPLRLSLGDYTFMASLVAEEAGYTVHTAPGMSLEGWTRPDVSDIHCDHCNLDRNRINLYIVRNDLTGELVQLGHSCIQLYTGFSPSGLFGLTFDEELRAFASEPSGAQQADTALEIDDVLATAFAYSDKGRSYASTKVRDFGKTPTIDKVRNHIFGGEPRFYGNRSDERSMAAHRAAVAEYRAKVIEIAEIRNTTGLLDAIKASVNATSEASDYGQNLRTILAGESGTVRQRNVGVLASLVAVYAKEQELAIERASAPKIAKGYLGEIGDRLRDLEITVRTVRYWEGFQPGSTNTLLVGVTPDMHLVVWKASKRLDVTTGDLMVLDGTVKERGFYKGDDQTVITRGKIKKIEVAA